MNSCVAGNCSLAIAVRVAIVERVSSSYCGSGWKLVANAHGTWQMRVRSVSKSAPHTEQNKKLTPLPIYESFARLHEAHENFLRNPDPYRDDLRSLLTENFVLHIGKKSKTWHSPNIAIGDGCLS